MSKFSGGGGGGGSSLSGFGGSGSAGGDNRVGSSELSWEKMQSEWVETLRKQQDINQELRDREYRYKRERDRDKKAIDSLRSSISDTLHKFEKEKLEPIKDQINQERIKVIEVIGIFVSIFTFVSAEITIMRGTCVVYWSGFTLILLGGLSFFVLMMRFMFKDLGRSGVNFANEKLVVENKIFIDGVWYNLKSIGSRIGYSTIILFVCSMILMLGGLAQTRSAMYNEADVCKNVADPSYSLILNGGETNVRVTR